VKDDWGTATSSSASVRPEYPGYPWDSVRDCFKGWTGVDPSAHIIVSMVASLNEIKATKTCAGRSRRRRGSGSKQVCVLGDNFTFCIYCIYCMENAAIHATKGVRDCGVRRAAGEEKSTRETKVLHVTTGGAAPLLGSGHDAPDKNLKLPKLLSSKTSIFQQVRAAGPPRRSGTS
jgi:hypothetical protein